MEAFSFHTLLQADENSFAKNPTANTAHSHGTCVPSSSTIPSSVNLHTLLFGKSFTCNCCIFIITAILRRLPRSLPILSFISRTVTSHPSVASVSAVSRPTRPASDHRYLSFRTDFMPKHLGADTCQSLSIPSRLMVIGEDPIARITASTSACSSICASTFVFL